MLILENPQDDCSPNFIKGSLASVVFSENGCPVVQHSHAPFHVEFFLIINWKGKGEEGKRGKGDLLLIFEH